MKAVIPMKSQDALPILQNRASFGAQNPSIKRGQVPRKAQQVFIVMIS